MGVATTRPTNGLGLQKPTKKLADWVDLLGQPLFRNHFFEIFMGDKSHDYHIIELKLYVQ